MLAASLGNYAGTTAALTGGLAGALHGSAWVPAAWWQHLQDEAPAQPVEQQQQPEAGSDAGQLQSVNKHKVVQLGMALAALDCQQPPSMVERLQAATAT